MKTKFKNLKNTDISKLDVSLVIVKEYKKERISQYDLKYVKVDEKLEKRLKEIVTKKVNDSNTFESYTFDCPEPEGDQVRAINYEETDFFKVFEKLKELNPEEDTIKNIDELVKAKAYLIVLRNVDGIKCVGFKTLPENWKMKKDKGLIPLLFNENRFVDLESENVFSISSFVDFIYFDDALFILSKRNFENGLNFREGMIAKAQQVYEEFKELNIFINLDILINRVSNNQRYLRKMATIKNLGYYKDHNYLLRLKFINEQRNWGIVFINQQIEISEEHLESILTLLQNKRLHSELTDETFDVDSVKKFQIQ